MGKGSKGRKRRRKHAKPKGKEALSPHRVSTLVISLPRLTVAKGHDGFLRGSPEPTLVFGAFLEDASPKDARTIARGLWRFESPDAFPSEVATMGDGKVKAELTVKRPGRLVLLAVALEEDAGDDVREVFAAMEDAARFEVWRSRDAIPHPQHLHELGEAFSEPARVNVQLDHVELDKRCTADDYIGAQVVVVDANRRQKRDVRFHFRSENGLNDWTALVHVRL